MTGFHATRSVQAEHGRRLWVEAVCKRSRANKVENYFLYCPFRDRSHSAIPL